MTVPDDHYRETMPAEACSPAGMRARAQEPAGERQQPATWPRADRGASVAAEPQEQPQLAATSARSRMIGAAEARYAITGMLGIGASGAVFEVHDQDLDRAVALKVLRADAERDAGDGFLSEARIAAGLAHPNVPPVLDVDLASDGRPFFTMHKVDGRTLLEVMGGTGAVGSSRAMASGTATSPISAPEQSVDARAGAAAAAPDRRAINRLVSIGIAVCNGLAYAHARGIVHQDIKPENLLIGAYGEVLILDWGSAGHLGADGRIAGKLYGTPLYMSPEQARAAWADARSDVYALAATLFHALLGRVPWWDPSPEAFWDGKRAGRLSEPTALERARVPTELIAIVLKGLSPVPEARYGSIAEMRRDLEHFQSGLRVGAFHYSPVAQLARWCRAHPTLLSSTAVAALALVLGWALLAHQRALEARRWHLVEHFSFTSLTEAASRWQGWAQEGYLEKTYHQTPLAAPDYGVEDGGILLGGKSTSVDLTCDRVVLGNVRIAWTVEGRWSGENLNCYIGGTDRTKGDTLHIGGWGSAKRLVLTTGETYRQLEWLELPTPMVPHQPYHMVLEREDRHLRLWIDARLVMDHIDVENNASESEERFGFDTYGRQQLRISEVSIYRQTPAQLVSPLVIPDQLFQERQWDEARSRYREIQESFPGTELARSAEFRAAQCLAAKGDQAGADAALTTFASAHGRDPLVPAALAQRFTFALNRDDEPAQDAISAALVPFAPNPVIAGMLCQKSERLMNGVPSGIQLIDQPERLAPLLALVDHYRGLCAAEQVVVPADDGFLNVTVTSLIACGRPELVRGKVPLESAMWNHALIASGHIAEACASPGNDGGASIAAGRLAEVADNPASDYDWRSFALTRLGRWDGLAQHNPHSRWLQVHALRTTADLERVLALLPLDSMEKVFGVSLRLTVLLKLGRAEEILRDYQNPSARAVALCALGRCDEGMALASYDSLVRMMAAQDALTHGHPERARAIVDGRASHSYQHDDLLGMVLPFALLAVWADAPDDARAMLAKEMAVKERGEQRFWYASAYVLGRIDQATFLSQPSQFDIVSDLALCDALRCELAGDRAGADACYRHLIAMPMWQRTGGPGLQWLLHWRAQLAGIPVPIDWGVVVMLD